MAENPKQSGGRRIVSQAEAEAVTAKAGVSSVTRTKVGKPVGERLGLNRREFMAYATAGSLAVLTALGLGTMISPNKDDDLVRELTGGGEWIPGGFAYPRIKAGQFGGKFTLARSGESYSVEEAPELNSTGKFFIVKVDKNKSEAENGIVPTNDNNVGVETGDGAYLIAIYQVCTHLGCLIPFQASQNRFICPCHGSTFERNSHYVLGPAPRNLDQFPVTLENGALVVDTGKKKTGLTHG